MNYTWSLRDRCDFPLSLKSATRVRRQGEQQSVYYRVTDSTHFAKVLVKPLLSDKRTKMELTEYLSAKVVQRSECMGKNIIVAWGCYCQGTHFDVTHLRSSQDHSPSCWCCFSWCNWNYNPFTRYRCFFPFLKKISTALQRYPVCYWNWKETASD